jgi:haloalkane dehalogenase
MPTLNKARRIKVDILRTPDTRFLNLPDYDFEPNYLTVGEGIRLHYIDAGPRNGPVVILMHGQPSWCYLYRHFIPVLVAAGCRVLAPDLIGFGRSDKLAQRSDYSYEKHVAWMCEWLNALDLLNVTMFCQDWGGLIGLRMVAAMPQRFANVIAGNTGLPIGAGMSEAFSAWVAYSQSVEVLPIGGVLQNATTRLLSDAEVAAYDAPFPDETYKEGARALPPLVPATPQHASVEENKQAWAVLATFTKPFLTAFSDSDPITAGGDKPFQSIVPGAAGQDHITIKGAHHFLQEDAGPQLTGIILTQMKNSGLI